MSNGILPVIRHLIVCDDVVVRHVPFERASINGLIHAIRSVGDPPFPHTRPIFKVFAQLTGCRGPGDVRVEIIQADTDIVIWRTRTFRARFTPDPLRVNAIAIELRNCQFPEPGLYEAHFCYNNVSLHSEPIILR